MSRRVVAGLILTVMAAGTGMVSAATTPKSTTTKSKSTSGTKGTTSTTSSTHKSTSTKSASGSTKSTSSKSSGKKSSKKKSSRPRGQTAPSPERIHEIQDALTKKGVYTGVPTGTWDDSTSSALRNFQSANHLTPTGKLDALTLQKLGLGSETAGLGAPTPPPNSAANRLLSAAAKRDAEKNETEPE